MSRHKQTRLSNSASKVCEFIKSNSTTLQPRLANTTEAAKLLLGHLNAKVSKGEQLPDKLFNLLDYYFRNTNKEWRKALAERANLNNDAIKNIQNMSWPDWVEIKPSVI